jgi:hypothetical protein
MPNDRTFELSDLSYLCPICPNDVGSRLNHREDHEWRDP